MWIRKHWLISLSLFGFVAALVILTSGHIVELFRSPMGHEAEEPLSKPLREQLSRAGRDRLMKQIQETRARRLAKETAASAAGAPSAGAREPDMSELEKKGKSHQPPAPPRQSREYIRRQIAEIRPLLEECVEQTAPGHEGVLQVSFVIDGEPGVGGLVRDSQIVDGTFPMSTAFASCVNATFTSIQVDPPEGGGTIHVNYPFSIRSSGRVEGPGLDAPKASGERPGLRPDSTNPGAGAAGSRS